MKFGMLSGPAEEFELISGESMNRLQTSRPICATCSRLQILMLGLSPRRFKEHAREVRHEQQQITSTTNITTSPQQPPRVKDIVYSPQVATEVPERHDRFQMVSGFVGWNPVRNCFTVLSLTELSVQFSSHRESSDSRACLARRTRPILDYRLSSWTDPRCRAGSDV